MDIIESLTKVHAKSVVLMVVDLFSKYAHFITFGHTYTALSVVLMFFNEVIRLHGIPNSIIMDHDPIFIGHVWRDLFKLACVQLKMSMAFHPQTDGQYEVVNKTIGMCITGDC